MTRKRRSGLTPRVSWPDLHSPQDDWTMAEMRAVAINPVVTGIGTHPRSVSDEDWVMTPFPAMIDDQMWIDTGIKLAREHGLRQYLVNLLYELKRSVQAVCAE